MGNLEASERSTNRWEKKSQKGRRPGDYAFTIVHRYFPFDFFMGLIDWQI